MRPPGRERPRVDHPVDRPELYGPRGLEVTGTNGRQLGHFYRPSLPPKEGSATVAAQGWFGLVITRRFVRLRIVDQRLNDASCRLSTTLTDARTRFAHL